MGVEGIVTGNKCYYLHQEADQGSQGDAPLRVVAEEESQRAETSPGSTSASEPSPQQEVSEGFTHDDFLRQHHIANPDDLPQILSAFRSYCAPFGGKKVPIPPEWSRLLLKLNRQLAEHHPGDLRQNRSIRRGKLEWFKKSFRDGTFRFTNIGIGFDTNGMLVDGQTRLTAGLETGVTFFANVDFDLEEDVFAVIDSHISARTTGDIAHMAGAGANTNLRVAIAALLYRKDHRLSDTERLDPRQIIEALQDYDIEDSLKVAVRARVPGPKSVIGAVHYLASKLNRDLADKVFEQLSSGAGMEVDDPVLVARKRLEKAYSSNANEFRGGSGPRRVRVLLSRMFNYRRRGDPVSKYLLDGGDDWPE